MRTSAEEANKELTKTESKLRGEMGDVKGSLVSKVDSDVAAVSLLPLSFPLSLAFSLPFACSFSLSLFILARALARARARADWQSASDVFDVFPLRDAHDPDGSGCDQVKKQVERVLDTSLEQFEELLGQTARRDDVVKALAAKADRVEVCLAS